MDGTYDLTGTYHFHDIAQLTNNLVKIYTVLSISRIIRFYRKNYGTVLDFFLARDGKRFHQLNHTEMLHGRFLRGDRMSSPCRKT